MIPLIVPVSYPKRIPPKAAKAVKQLVASQELRGYTCHEDGRQFRPAIGLRGIDETHIDDELREEPNSGEETMK